MKDMQATDPKIEEIEALLHRVERKYAQDPLFNEVCALAALCLLARSGETSANPATMKSVFERSGISGAQLEAIVEALGSHWREYGELIGRYSEDDLVDLFEKRYVRLIREKVQCSPSMDALSLKLLSVKAGESCLDICAGAGFFVNEAWMSMSRLARSGESVDLVGVEFNTDLARYAALLSAIRGTGHLVITRSGPVSRRGLIDSRTSPLREGGGPERAGGSTPRRTCQVHFA